MELRIDSHRLSALPVRLSRISAVMALLAILACGDGSTKPPIDPPNQAPVATGGIPDQTVTAGETTAVDVAQYFSDPDGDALSYSVETSNANVATTSVSGSVVTLVGVAKGNASVTVTATDPEGLSATQKFDVTVPNRAPLAVDSITALELASGDSATLDLSAHFTDPDGDSLTFAAETSDGAVAAAAVVESVMTIRALGHGAATVSAFATDTDGLSATLTAAITVTNLAPEAVGTIPPQTVKELRSVTVGLHDYFRDPEEGTLTYTASISDAVSATVVTSDSAVVIKGLSEGAVTVTVTATDLGGLSAEQGFEVTVEALTDREVLEAIYYAMDGPNWEGSANWLTDLGLGFWQGVRVDETGRVTGLHVSSNNLSGSLPPEIGYLDSIDFLNASFNSITSIPPEIGRLSRLEVLWLEVMQLSALPSEIGGLSMLRSLQLAENQLTTLPREIGNLASLEELHLRWNGLTSIPDEIGKLSGLRVLSLGVNQLTTLPPAIGNLTNLKSLWLSDNQLTRFPAWIDKLTSLESLALSKNPLTGAIPVGIGKLANLTILRLSDNGLFGPIPSELGNLTSLEYLSLSGNQLFGPIPSELGNLARLQSLSLGGNDLTGSIPPELGSLANLQSLGLGGNDLTGSIPPELGNLVKAHWLSLAGNNLSGSIPPELGSLANLESLRLASNDLTGPIPSEIGNLVKARWLNLGGNLLTGSIPPELGNLVNLEGLWLEGNDLTGPVPTAIGSLAELWYLDLTSNSGMSGTLPSTLTDLRLLTEFWAGGTDLCAPRDADFQRWLAEVASQRVAQCAYGGTSTAYLTQAIQSLDFPVPLVGDEEALLRVFVTAENAAGELIPPVRASFFLGGAEVRVLEIPQGTHSIPAEIIEGDLSASANANVPADLIQPGLEMVIEIDPEGTLDPALGVTNRIPETGRLAIDIRVAPTLQFTLLPFLYQPAPDSTILELTRDMAADPDEHELLWATRALLPVREMSVELHEPVLTSTNDAHTLAWNTRVVRAIEGSIGFYVGMMSGKVERGVAGSAYSYRAGFSIPEPTALAHSIGHDFSLSHAPCGDPSREDSRFPNEDGSTNAWGYDFRGGGSLVPPSQPDLMSGCDSRWISDYHFSKALRYRLANEDPSPTPAPAKSLLLWGGVNADGEPYLEPAFVVRAPPTIEPSGGNYEIVGSTSSGDTLFALRFELGEQSGGETPGSSFAFLLPVRPEWAESLAALTLSGPGGAVTLDGDSDQSMTILRDSLTGQVRGILRDLPESALGRAAREPNLQVLFSRGIPDAAAWRR